ncbi:MAG TPA: diguanylate cyclase [Sumerlaeia bacterium]|nr:diguanylate cyclase [Sumerlaeia bacterium]
MGALNHTALVRDPATDCNAFLESLSSEGFPCAVLEPADGILSAIAEIEPAAVLLDAKLERSRLSRLARQIKERFPYVPLVLVLGGDGSAANAPSEQPENTEGGAFLSVPVANTLCYLEMPASHLALILRGAIRSAFTLQELAHSNRDLSQISITDALTGLHNRGYMMNRLSLEFKRAGRNRQILSCLMIDLDHFKQINDTYGHKFGDVVLRAVADRLKGLVRETDIFGRYGGEEFLIILPDTDRRGARNLAEKLRAGLEAERIQHDCFSLLATASFGVASTQNPAVITADHLLQLSDRALYQAKESGRNRVGVAGEADRSTEQGNFVREEAAGQSQPRIDVVSLDPDLVARFRALPLPGDYGLTVHPTESDFLHAFQERTPWLIIIDHDDRGPDGVEGLDALALCRRIKTQLQDVFVPLAICLRRRNASLWEDAFDAGADDVVFHDLGERELLAHLSSLSHLRELRDRWRETNRDLTMARTRLIRAERLSALGEMAGGVAHDFNNILSAILGRTQLMRQTVEDANLRQNLEIIERAANDGAATIRRIQEFSRSATSRTYEILDMTHVIGDCIQMTRTRWKDEAELRGLQYRFETDFCGPLHVRGSATELREVITNLIMNALDAMPKGGKMVFEGTVIEDRVLLTVSDTGVGMSEEILKQVFDPFFSTKRGEGTGLGLSVAYGIILRHEGRIECSSHPNEGTAFRIELPHQPIRGFPEAAARVEGGIRGTGPRVLSILVVDDEPAIREIFSDVLSQEGHTVHMAESGQAALKFLEKERIDLLFTDLSMPEMSGWEVARQVRKAFPGVAIVLTSGWGKDFNQDQIAQHGVDYVLAKPVSFHTLATLTRQVAEGRPIRLSVS